jgi:hypothetical protein
VVLLLAKSLPRLLGPPVIRLGVDGGGGVGWMLLDGCLPFGVGCSVEGGGVYGVYGC